MSISVSNNLICSICGSPLYRTDAGGLTASYQCSSSSAQFWNYQRGTDQQNQSHKHFIQSLLTIKLNLFYN